MSESNNNSPFFTAPTESSGSKDLTGQDLLEVYLAYFDEMRGHEVLLRYPAPCQDFVECLRPISIHSIWFLSPEEQAELDQVTLDYGRRTYFARKFTAPSHRKKSRAGIEEADEETLVLFVSLPEELYIFGGRILSDLHATIKEELSEDLCDLIIGHIAKKKIIPSSRTRAEIKRGNVVTEKFLELCDHVVGRYSADLVENFNLSIKRQKALAFGKKSDLDPKEVLAAIKRAKTQNRHLSMQDVADQFGVYKNIILYILEREIKAALEEAREEGASVESIAEEFGVPLKTVLRVALDNEMVQVQCRWKEKD